MSGICKETTVSPATIGGGCCGCDEVGGCKPKPKKRCCNERCKPKRACRKGGCHAPAPVMDCADPSDPQQEQIDLLREQLMAEQERTDAVEDQVKALGKTILRMQDDKLTLPCDLPEAKNPVPLAMERIVGCCEERCAIRKMPAADPVWSFLNEEVAGGGAGSEEESGAVSLDNIPEGATHVIVQGRVNHSHDGFGSMAITVGGYPLASAGGASIDDTGTTIIPLDGDGFSYEFKNNGETGESGFWWIRVIGFLGE